MDAQTKSPEDLTAGIRIIDVDTHYSEPYDLWTKRAPASLKDRVPQLMPTENGMSWIIDGNLSIGDGGGPSSCIDINGMKTKGMEFRDWTMSDCYDASYDPKSRVAMMDEKGIAAQILYPNIMGFGGQRAGKVDPELRMACATIYNDAMGELQEESGQRLFPMAMLPWWDVDAAVAEIRRTHAFGLRGVNLNSDPQNHKGADGNPLPDLGSRHWDPLWEACIEHELPINFHIGASDQSIDWFGDQGWPSLSLDLKHGLGSAMLFVNNSRVMANIIFSGLLDRYPQLKFVSVESGIGWIPFILEALDFEYDEVDQVGALQRKPSEYFKTNFYACFWFERENLAETARQVGIDNVMFETDFPHPNCLYPDPMGYLSPGLQKLTRDERSKILGGNAAKLYKI